MPLNPKSTTSSLVNSSKEPYTRLFGRMGFDTLTLYASMEDYHGHSEIDYVANLDEEDLVDWLKELSQPFEIHARLTMRENQWGNDELFVKFQIHGAEFNRAYGASFCVRCDGNSGLTNFMKMRPPLLTDGEVLTATPVQMAGLTPEGVKANLFFMSKPFTYTDDNGDDEEYDHLFTWAEGGWIRVFPSTPAGTYDTGNQYLVIDGDGDTVGTLTKHGIVVTDPLPPLLAVQDGKATAIGKTSGINVKNAGRLFEVTPAITIRALSGPREISLIGAYHDEENGVVRLMAHKSKTSVHTFDPLVTVKYDDGGVKKALESIGYTLVDDSSEQPIRATYVKTLFGLKDKRVARVYAIDSGDYKFITVRYDGVDYRAFASNENGSSSYGSGESAWGATSHKDAMERLGYTVSEPEDIAEIPTATFVEQKEITEQSPQDSFRYLYKLSHGVFVTEPTSIYEHLVVWVTPIGSVKTGVYTTDSAGNPSDWTTAIKHYNLVSHDDALSQLGFVAHGTPLMDIKMPVKEATLVKKHEIKMSGGTGYVYHVTPNANYGGYASTPYITVWHTKSTVFDKVTHIFPCDEHGNRLSTKHLWSWLDKHLDPTQALESYGNYKVVESKAEATTPKSKTATLIYKDAIGVNGYQLTPSTQVKHVPTVRFVLVYHFKQSHPRTQMWAATPIGEIYMTTGSAPVWSSDDTLSDTEALAAFGYTLVTNTSDSTTEAAAEEKATATLVRMKGISRTYYLSKPYKYGNNTTDYVEVLLPSEDDTPAGNIVVLPCNQYGVPHTYSNSVQVPIKEGVDGALAKMGYTVLPNSMVVVPHKMADDYSVWAVSPQHAYYSDYNSKWLFTDYLRVESKFSPSDGEMSTSIYPCTSGGAVLSTDPAWYVEDQVVSATYALLQIGYHQE